MKLSASISLQKYFDNWFMDFIYLFKVGNRFYLDCTKVIDNYTTEKLDILLDRKYGICYDAYNIMSSYLLDNKIKYDSYLLVPNNPYYLIHPIIVVKNNILNYGVPKILDNKINENENKIIPFDTFKNSYTYYKLEDDSIFRKPNVCFRELKEKLYKQIGL